MSGVRDGGVDRAAGDDRVDAEQLRRGGGGYEGETVAGNAGGGTGGEVRRLIEVLERRINQLEEEAKIMKNELEKKTKGNESSKYELVNMKEMTPKVLKDSTAFRTWREEFERWSGLKVKGMQDVLKLIGGKGSGEEIWRRKWKRK